MNLEISEPLGLEVELWLPDKAYKEHHNSNYDHNIPEGTFRGLAA